MNFKFVTLFLIIFCLFRINANSQNTSAGYLYLKVYGTKDPHCKVDEIPFHSSDTILTCTPGSHRIQVWKPTASLLDTTVSIRNNDTTRYSCTLEYSKAYINYLNDYSDYKRLRNKQYYVSPIWAGIAIGAGVFVDQVWAQRQYDLAMDVKAEYLRRGNQGSIDDEKSLFDGYRKKYDNYKKLEYGIYGVSGLIMANYVRILIKQSKIPVPQFKEENLLSKIDFNVYPSIATKGIACGLSLHF
ncbi:MAG: hypothetical protein JWP12_3042 [Bacteroidetes bacterium]|nr:hypothetical protein [Bacteroidota bacterium]